MPTPTYDAQVLFVRTSRCLRCGAIHTISELFACDPHDRVRHMRPATVFSENIPLEKIAMNPRLTPICHACTDSVQPTTDRESYMRWQDTLRKKRAEQQAATVAERVKRKETTLEDLI